MPKKIWFMLLVRPTWLYTYEVEVLYSCPRIAKMLYQLLAEGKGILVRGCLEEAQVQKRESMYKNVIEGPVPEMS